MTRTSGDRQDVRGTATKPPVSPGRTVRLGLLQGFQLERADSAVDVPLSSQRVLAFLAFADAAIDPVLLVSPHQPDETCCTT